MCEIRSTCGEEPGGEGDCDQAERADQDLGEGREAQEAVEVAVGAGGGWG